MGAYKDGAPVERISGGRAQPVLSFNSDLVPHDTSNVREEGFEVPLVAGQTLHQKDFSFGFNIDLIAAEVFADWPSANPKDTFDVLVIPENDGLVGIVTASAAAGATTISVSETVVQNVRQNWLIVIGAENFEYTINSVDAAAGTVTLAQPLNTAKTIGDTVKLRVPVVLNRRIYKNQIQQIGTITEGAKGLKAGQILRIRYRSAVAPTANDTALFTLVYRY